MKIASEYMKEKKMVISGGVEILTLGRCKHGLASPYKAQ